MAKVAQSLLLAYTIGCVAAVVVEHQILRGAAVAADVTAAADAVAAEASSQQASDSKSASQGKKKDHHATDDEGLGDALPFDRAGNLLEKHLTARILHHCANASNYLEQQAATLGAPEVEVMALRIAQVTADNTTSMVSYKVARSAMQKVVRRGAGGLVGGIQEFCRNEIKVAGPAAKKLQDQLKKQDGEVSRLTKMTGRIQKELETMKPLLNASEKKLAAVFKATRRQHAKYARLRAHERVVRNQERP